MVIVWRLVYDNSFILDGARPFSYTCIFEVISPCLFYAPPEDWKSRQEGIVKEGQEDILKEGV